MEINLANYVGQKVITTQRDGSVLAGMLTNDGPAPFIYKIQGRLFLGNGQRPYRFEISDEDIVDISLVETHYNTIKDLLTLLSNFHPEGVFKPPYNIRRKENGEFVLSVVADWGDGFGQSNYVLTNSVIFSEDGEDTGRGSTTLRDLVHNSKRERVLAKLTAEDREVLGL